MSEADLLSKAQEVKEAAIDAATWELSKEASYSKLAGEAKVVPGRDDIANGDIDTDAFPTSVVDTALIESIPDQFRWMTVRNYSSLDATYDSLQDIRDNMLTIKDNEAGDHASYLRGEWDDGQFKELIGVTGKEFGGYMGKIADALQAQKRACEDLQKAAAMTRHLARGTEDHLIKVADKTIHELGKISGRTGGGDSSLLFWVLGAAIGIGSATTAGGVALALADVTLDGIETMLEENPQKPKSEIAGYTTNDVLTSMMDVIAELKQTLGDREKDIGANLRNDYELFTGQAKNIISPKPYKGWT